MEGWGRSLVALKAAARVGVTAGRLVGKAAWLCRTAWERVLSMSSKEKDWDEKDPGGYESGAQTHHGFWVMVREA